MKSIVISLYVLLLSVAAHHAAAKVRVDDFSSVHRLMRRASGESLHAQARARHYDSKFFGSCSSSNSSPTPSCQSESSTDVSNHPSQDHEPDFVVHHRPARERNALSAASYKRQKAAENLKQAGKRFAEGTLAVPVTAAVGAASFPLLTVPRMAMATYKRQPRKAAEHLADGIVRPVVATGFAGIHSCLNLGYGCKSLCKALRTICTMPLREKNRRRTHRISERNGVKDYQNALADEKGENKYIDYLMRHERKSVASEMLQLDLDELHEDFKEKWSSRFGRHLRLKQLCCSTAELN